MPDILLNAAVAYQQLINYTYIITIKTNKDIVVLNIDFDKESFKHLTSVEKLQDHFVSNKHLSSNDFMKMVLTNKIAYVTLCQSRYINKPINKTSQNGIKYYISDRLNALIDLQSYFKMQIHKI